MSFTTSRFHLVASGLTGGSKFCKGSKTQFHPSRSAGSHFAPVPSNAISAAPPDQPPPLREFKTAVGKNEQATAIMPMITVPRILTLSTPRTGNIAHAQGNSRGKLLVLLAVIRAAARMDNHASLTRRVSRHRNAK